MVLVERHLILNYCIIFIQHRDHCLTLQWKLLLYFLVKVHVSCHSCYDANKKNMRKIKMSWMFCNWTCNLQTIMQHHANSITLKVLLIRFSHNWEIFLKWKMRQQFIYYYVHADKFISKLLSLIQFVVFLLWTMKTYSKHKTPITNQ